MRGLGKILLVGMLWALLPAASALAQVCAAPGASGPATISGIINTYYSGRGVAFAGSTSIPVGSADGRGSGTPIAGGDLLLVVQLQDAAINSSNSASYGGSSPGRGYTALNSAGAYEYVTAAAAVAGGSVAITSPLLNTYTTASASSFQGQRSFQVIRVPQYSSATLGGTLTAPPWNGSTGGVVVVEVAGNLNWNSQGIDVNARGFRGGAGQRSGSNGTGDTLASTDYVSRIGAGTVTLTATSGSVPNGAKGEGIAGTPIVVYVPNTPNNDNVAGTAVNTGGTDGSSGGYPTGSFGRGAPGNAGGGGSDGNPTSNDQNTGGGGGGNYGTGGTGGFGWTPGTPPGSQTGGFGGGSVPSSPSRMFFGGGGGAGSSNDGTSDNSAILSSGASGGGMVFVRAGTVTGSGTINANGGNGNISATPPTTVNGGVANDAAGGGGAGGSVLVFVNNGGGATGATINVNGGKGGNNAPGTGANCPHGPGGGGSGGYAVVSGAAGISVNGGANGITCSSPTTSNEYGSTTSPGGFSLVTLTATQIPGVSPSPTCYPRLTVGKSTTTPNVSQGSVATYVITVANQSGYGAASGAIISDTLPNNPNFTFAATSSVVMAGGATRTAVSNPAANATSPAWGTFSIPGGGSVTITFTVNVAAATPLATYQNPAAVVYNDPTATTAGQTVTPGGTYAGGGTVLGSNYVATSTTNEDITVRSPATFAKSFNPGSIGANGTSVLTVQLNNTASIGFTNATFTDNYPAGLVNAATPAASTTCAGGTVTATPGATSFTLSGATLAATANCQVTVTLTSATAATYINTIPAGALTTDQNVTNAAAATATLLGRPTVVKSFSPAAVPQNTNATLTFTINNPNATQALSGLAFTDTYPANLINATPLTVGGTCTGVTVSGTTLAGGSVFNVTAGNVPANASCTITVAVRSAVAGNYANATSGAVSAQTPDAGMPSNTANLGVGLIGVTKAFGTSPIAQGGTSTVTLTLNNPTGVAQTAGAFSDTLSNMSISANQTVGGTCTGVTPSALTAGQSVLNFSGINIPAAGCTITFVVTSGQIGSNPNTTTGVSTALLPAGPPSNTANLVVTQKPTIAKSFAAASFPVGGSTTMIFTIVNPDSIALTGANFTDALPANLVNASPLTVGGTCSGVTTSGSTVGGGSTFNVTSATIPPSASCTVTVLVTASVAGTYNNTASGVATNETGSAGTASNTASVNVVVPPTHVSKAFSPGTIAQNGTSTITFTINNPNAVALTSINFTDTLSAMTVASTAIGGTCAGTTNSPVLTVGATSLNLTVPALAAGATCTITVQITSNAGGPHTNQANGMTSAQTPSPGAASNTATLNVLQSPLLQKNFVPGQINLGGTSTMTFTVSNPNTTALTNVAFSDPLSNMTVASNSFSTTCSGAVSFSPALVSGGNQVNPTIANLAANENCTISVTVTSNSVSGASGHVNTTSGATSNQTAVAGAPATASLDVYGPVTIAKSFGTSPIQTGGTSTITFTLTNPNPVTMTGAAFSDTFPSGMTTIAAAQTFTGGGRGTCTGAIPNAKAAGTTTSVSFAGINVPAGGSCTVMVDVTAAAAGAYVNTVSGVTSFQVPTAGPTASATLAVNAAPTVGKVFSPSTIATGGSATLTLTITNPNGVALTNVSIADTYPNNLRNLNAATTNTCGGTATASANATNPGTLTLAGGSLPANGNCTITATVTATTAASYANTTSGATSAETPTAGATASDTLTVVAAGTNRLIYTKTFSQSQVQVPAGGASLNMEFQISNLSAGTAAQDIVFSSADTMPTAGGAQMVLNSAANSCTITASTGSCTYNGVGTIGTVVPNSANSTTSLNFATAGTGLRLTAGSTCTLTCPVTIPGTTTGGTYTNTATALSTSTGGFTATTGDTASVVALRAPTIAKAFSPATIGAGGTSTVTFTLTNPNALALANGTFTDTLTNMSIFGAQSAGGTCAGAGGNSFADGQTGAVTLTGLTLPASGACTVTLLVSSANVGTNPNTTSGVTTTQTPTAGTGAASVSLVVVGTTLTKAFAPASMRTGQSSTLTFTIANGAGNPAQSGLAFTDTFPTNVVIANPANASTTCGAGTITGGPGSGSVAFSGGSMTLGQANCTIKIDVTSATAGTYNNAAANVTGTSTGMTNSVNATLTVYNNAVLTKAFSPAAIGLNGTSTLTFTIANGTGAPAQSGLGFTDTLPANVVIATPNGLVGGCGSTVTAAAGAGAITVSGASVGAAPSSCTISVNVTSATAGAYLNNTSNISGLAGGMGAATLSSTLNVVGAALTKSFSPSTQQVGSNTQLTFTIANGAGNPAQSALAFTDSLPTNLVVATPNGLVNNCGGTATAVAGSTSVALSGGTMTAGTATCTIVVNVASASAGVYTNNAARVSGVSSNLDASAVNASVTYLSRAGIAKSFSPSTINADGVSTITFSLTNANSIDLTAASFTDTLSGMSISGNQAAGGTCAGASGLNFTAGQTALGFTGLVIPPGGCTVTVAVTGDVPGTYNNTTSGVTTAETAIGTPSNTAQLTISAVAPTIAKAFAPATIDAGGSSTITFTLANTNGVASTGAAFTDTLVNMTISGAQSATGTCAGAAGNSFTNGQTSLAFSGLTIPLNGNCTVAVVVTSGVAGTLPNQSSGVSSAQAPTGAASNVANLLVQARPALTKSFGTAVIGVGLTTSLTFVIDNSAAGAVARAGIGFTDTLPPGLTATAATPQCGGTVAVTSGNVIALSGANVAAGATCSITATVTGASAGSYVNGAAQISALAGGLGNGVTNQPLDVVQAALTKAFGTAAIDDGSTTTLVYTLTNGAGAPAQSGIGFTETLPTGLRFAAASQAVAYGAGCSGPATVTASGGPPLNQATLSGIAMAAGTASCTITVGGVTNVSGQFNASCAASPAAFTNASTRVTSLIAVTNNIGAGPCLVVNALPVLSKALPANPQTVGLGQNAVLTFTIANTGTAATARSGLGFVDTFPAGMVVGTPNGLANNGNCGTPTVTATAGAGSVSVANVSVAAGATCTISINVTGSAAGSYVNGAAQIGGVAGALTNAVVNQTLNVRTVALTKGYAPASISATGTSTLTFTLTNGTGNPAQSGIVFTDTLAAGTGLTVTAVSAMTGTGCSGTPSIASATNPARVALAGGAITAGNAACSFTATVTGNTAGTYLNSNANGSFSGVSAVTDVTGANATLTVVNRATLAKAYSATTIGVGGTSTLTFTITNGTGNPAQSGLAFTDTFPTGMTVTAVSAMTGTGCSGTPAFTATTVSLSGGAITAGNAACTFTATVQGTAPGAYVNDGTRFSGQGGGLDTSAVSATLNVRAVAVTKNFSAASIPSGSTSTLTFTVTNGTGNPAQSGIAFTDTLTLGSGLTVTAVGAMTGTGCSGTPSILSATNPARVALANGAITAGNATCTVTATVMGNTAGTYLNSNANGNFSGISAVTDVSGASSTLVVFNRATLAKAYSATNIGVGGASTLTFTISNGAGNPAQSGLAFTDTFAAGTTVTAVGAMTGTGCSGTPAFTATTVSLSGGAITAGNAACTFTATVQGTAAGAYLNDGTRFSGQGGGLDTGAVNATLNVFAPPTVTKSFAPSTIGVGGTSTMTIIVANPVANPATLTGVAINDAYAGTLANAAAGNVACTGAGSATLSGGVSGGTAVGFNAGAIVAGGSCTITQAVTATSTSNNTTTAPTAAGPAALTGVAGSATLTVAIPAVAKTFAAAAISDGASTALRFTLTNAGGLAQPAGITLGDTLPIGLRFTSASPTVSYSGTGGTCGGPATAGYVAGTRVLTIAGITLGAGATSCVVEVDGLTNVAGQVGPCPSAAQTNLAANVTATNATVGGADQCLAVNAIAPTLTKTFTPTTFVDGGTTVLRFTLSNAGTNPAQSGIGFTDTLPSGIRVAAGSVLASSTCANAATVTTATSGAGAITVAGATMANGEASCTIDVQVRNSAGQINASCAGSPAAFTNGAGNIGGLANLANGVIAACVTVTANAPAIAKAFSPASIGIGANTAITFTLTNTNSVPLTGAAFSDTLSGMSIGAAGAAGGTCAGAAANSFAAGATNLSFSGLTIPAASSCTVSVSVTSGAPGTYPNTASGVSSNEAPTGAPSATVNLTVTATAPTIAKSFAPATIASGGVSRLTLTIANPNAAAITVTGVTDTFPTSPGSGLVRSGTGNPLTDCAGGTVGSSAGGLTLTGGTVPANGSCTVQIDVTAAAAGNYANSIPIGGLTTNVGANTAAASATLTVNPVANVAVVKTAPATILHSTTLTYTVVVSNAGPDAANGTVFSDAVPAAITAVAASCGAAAGGAVCGAVNVAGNNVTSTIATLPAGGSVTFTIQGTAPQSGVIANSASAIVAAGISDPDDPGRTGAGNNTSTATTAVQAPDLQLVKTATGAFTVGGSVGYTLTPSNGGTAPSAGTITVVDTLPAGLTYVPAGSGGIGWTCGAAGQVVTCTSAAVIAAGANGNAISVNVNIGSTAVPSVTNTATVSGGNEPAANTGNNSAVLTSAVSSAAVNTFTTDGAQTGLPGSSVLYTHTFNAGLAGAVAFSAVQVATPATPGWTVQIYRDQNCNGVLDGTEGAAVLSGSVAVAPGDQVCIVVKSNIPAAAPYNGQDVITVTAAFTPVTGAGTNYTRQDITTVGAVGGAGLTLAKSVRNVTQGGSAGTANIAKPGEVLEYVIAYTNTSATAVSTIVISDNTPAFTTFLTASCGLPLPSAIAACNVTSQPSAGGAGNIQWTLTGSLNAAQSGTVLFRVTVQ